MNKILSVTVVVLAVLAIAFAANNSIEPGSFAGPRVIAKVNLTNQTAAIPTTTLFTPQQSGLYRVSAYMTMTTPVSGSTNQWTVPLTWVDDAGTETAALVQLQVAPGPSQDFGQASLSGIPDCAFTIRVLAGNPVTFYTYPSSAGGTYALYIVAERLD